MTSPAGNKRTGLPRGFTLVELMAVVAILGVLAGVTAVSLRGLRSPALASAANEVASAMKMTRQMAIASGRRNFLVFPIASNALTSNLFRSYAVFEEVPPGESTTRPDSGGVFATNNGNQSWFIPRTEFRVLPEGVVFCNLATASYSTIEPDLFSGLTLGQLSPRQVADTVPTDEEWRFFQSYTNLAVRREDNPAATLATLDNAPFIAFYPNGRAFYLNPGSSRQGAALRIVPGFAQGNQIAVTDTNNFYYIETDPFIGRIRVRNRESYR